jgi:hypothetical protein
MGNIVLNSVLQNDVLSNLYTSDSFFLSSFTKTKNTRQGFKAANNWTEICDV